MLKIVTAGILVTVILLALGYYEFGDQPIDKRSAIEQGIGNARSGGGYNLTPGDEDYLRVQLALYDYADTNGAPPESLTDLVPVYFDSVPRNPATKQPFKYSKNGQQFDLERPIMVATADASVTGKMAGVSGMLESESDFVNPNTMVESDFVYDPTGKRDPFQPFDFSKRRNGGGLLSPLEQYSLGQLRVSAILAAPEGKFMAVVEDEIGKGYTVSSGTKIGDNGGVIITIEKEVVKVLETHVDFTGAEKQRVVEMKLIRETSERGNKRRNNSNNRRRR